MQAQTVDYIGGGGSKGLPLEPFIVEEILSPSQLSALASEVPGIIEFYQFCQ